MSDTKTVTFDTSQYQLVPKVPTNAQLTGIATADSFDPYTLYAAMLATAPAPAAQSAGQEPSAYVRHLPNSVYLDSTGCKTRWEDLPDGTPVYAAPVNGGERGDGGDSERILREFGNFEHPDERAADAPQVGGRMLNWDSACVVLNKWLKKNPSSFDAECELFCELAALTSPAKVGGDEREAYIASLPADWHKDSSLETWFPLTADELAATKRMFGEACADLGRVNEALGLDPDDAGAEPILDAIEELKARAALSADGGEQHPEGDVGPLLCEAATTLPEGWEIVVEVENGYGGVNLIAPDKTETDFSGQDMLLSEQIRAAIDAAIDADQARKGE